MLIKHYGLNNCVASMTSLSKRQLMKHICNISLNIYNKALKGCLLFVHSQKWINVTWHSKVRVFSANPTYRKGTAVVRNILANPLKIHYKPLI